MAFEMPHGRIVWYENFTTDRDKALAFYTRLFGWTTAPSQGGNPGYTILSNGGVPFGGVMQMPPVAAQAGVPPHWYMYVGARDLDASIAKAVSLGARPTMPVMEVPGMGRFSVLFDPQGASFAMFTALEPAADRPDPPATGRVAWNELATTDQAAAFDFYGKMFGWEKRAAVNMGPHGTYQLWSRPGTPFDLGGMYNRMPEMPVNAWTYYFLVRDLEASVAQAKSLGATLIAGPRDVPGGSRIAVLNDPCGAVFALTWNSAQV